MVLNSFVSGLSLRQGIITDRNGGAGGRKGEKMRPAFKAHVSDLFPWLCPLLPNGSRIFLKSTTGGDKSFNS